jgi:hypothetical protein
MRLRLLQRSCRLEFGSSVASGLERAARNIREMFGWPYLSFFTVRIANTVVIQRMGYASDNELRKVRVVRVKRESIPAEAGNSSGDAIQTPADAEAGV